MFGRKLARRISPALWGRAARRRSPVVMDALIEVFASVAIVGVTLWAVLSGDLVVR